MLKNSGPDTIYMRSDPADASTEDNMGAGFYEDCLMNGTGFYQQRFSAGDGALLRQVYGAADWEVLLLKMGIGQHKADEAPDSSRDAPGYVRAVRTRTGESLQCWNWAGFWSLLIARLT